MNDAAISFRNVSFTYPGGGASALEDVSFDIAPGERVGVLGPNGGGKSTLMKLALGVLTPQRGEIQVFGASPDRARRGGAIGYVAQRCEAELRFPVNVRQMVEMGASRTASPLRRIAPDVRARVDDALALVGASELADKPVGELSGGQLQRALIARALAAAPRILALDEPMIGIDAVGQQRFAELLKRLHERLGLTIVIISHDLRAIAASCDRVLCLARKMHMHGSPSGLTPAVLAEVFAHDLAPALGDVHVEAHLASECPGHGEG
jgi:zinc transport system ATP-binding protein